MTNISTPVVMSSMQGADVTLVVTKNPGLEMADILDAEGSADGGSAAAWLKHLTGWGDSSAGPGAGESLFLCLAVNAVGRCPVTVGPNRNLTCSPACFIAGIH